ncbi:uncharacterized protein [Magallana gigas]|uniref:uncharacterized protein isoform X3 n=1 Tax=Magallana gigas TaxID=29159 RepID=UPI00333F6606
MINKGSRAGSGKKPHLRLLDLTFDNGVTKTEPQPKPHGGLRGSKKHPLSPYSFNKTSEYHVQLRDDINKLFREEFFDGRGSPAWAFDISKEITHSGESPFHVHGLLSTSKLESETSSVHNIRRSVTPASSARNTPRKRNTGSSFYHPPSPHQYLTATDTSQLSAKELKYGRPTRTTLLRARQRCASAPVNSYDVRRELVKKSENSPSTNQINKDVLVAHPEGESPHAFLTGARYNRAHFLDAKSLSVYGVYMPRTNPQGIFMTGHAKRSRDKGQNIPAVPPDSPRSDVDDASKPMEKRPSTAPGKRLLSSTPSQHPGGRPRSAWGDNSTTCHLVHGDTESENEKPKKKVVLVTFKGSRNFKSSPESILPSVTGRTAPKTYYRRPRDVPDDSASLHNQPPPTPVGAFSARDGSDQVPNETDQENILNSFVENADDQPPLHTDADNRLEKIAEKTDDDIGENINKSALSRDIMPEDSGLTSFEAKKDISPKPQEGDTDSKEGSRLQDITKVTLNGQTEPNCNELDSVDSVANANKEVFITNNDKQVELINDSVDEAAKENGLSDQKTGLATEEEIPTQIHVTITEKQQESKLS